jgi:hypothetical protein
MSDNLCIDLEPRVDNDGRTYFIGRLRGDIQISAKEGLVFLVFTAVPGEEQLQLAPMAPKKPHHDR